MRLLLILALALLIPAGAKAAYRPDGKSVVTVNGDGRFNRAIYGGRDGFRLECSDTPEFAFYLPRMGGNLLLTLPDGKCTARYTPGRMDYSCGNVEVSAQVLRDKGIAIWAIRNNASTPVTIPMRFGGAADKRFSREGDLGVDPADCFDLKPEYCKGNTYSIAGQTATCTFGAKEKKQISIVAPVRSFRLTDGPVLNGDIDIKPGQTVYMAYFAPGVKPLSISKLPGIMTKAEKQRQSLAGQIDFDTPDEWLNPIGGALGVAADALWGGQTWLHGSIGWRTPHLGWRGAYAGDALGMHDKALTHFRAYADNQVTDCPPVLSHPRQDSTLLLARAEKRWGTPFYSNGYICRRPGKKDEMSHYDMNIVYIDALLRHFRHTGDTKAMRELFPTIKRHLEWEKLNFDPDGDHLYDAYACIWASDALFYSGGAVTHSTAYNMFANRLAAQVAEAIGEDPTPFLTEADAISKALDSTLWLKDKGHWAEYKDLLGHGRLHPSAALWTIYHAIDSEVADPFKRYAATCYVDSVIPHIPLGHDGLALLSTTDWKPYSWSINNVAIAEMMHMALAYWQAGRADDGYRLMKSVAMDNMYDGASPLNFGQISSHDPARGECYRDFGDGTGVWSRAIMEGLFGIRPDLLASSPVVEIRPGFPAGWDKASVTHPDLSYSFGRKGDRITYTIENNYPNGTPVRLVIPVDRVPSHVTVNGKPTTFKADASSIGTPRIIINAGNKHNTNVEVTLGSGLDPKSTGQTRNEGPVKFTCMRSGDLTWWEASVDRVNGTPAVSDGFNSVYPAYCHTVDLSTYYNDSVSSIFRNRYTSPRPAVTTLRIPTSGIGEWCHPDLTADIDDSGLRDILRRNGGVLTITSGIPFTMNADGRNIIYTSLWDNYPDLAEIPLAGHASNIYMVLAGSTNHMQAHMENGRITVKYTDGTTTAMPLINPDNWAPIEQDFYNDSHSFRLPVGMKAPLRLSLRDGHDSRELGRELGLREVNPRLIPGGAAVVLDMPVDPTRELASITIETLSNDVVIGLMALTLQEPVSPTAWYPVKMENKPFVRWWWHGSAVDKPGLSWNLREFSSKGIGGVEITPIYGVMGNEANDIDYLSPRWMEMLSHTVAEGRKLGVQVDMNNGTGWPFGGPDISTDDSARKLVVETYDIPSGSDAPIRIEPTDKKQQPVATLQRVIAVTEAGSEDITSSVGADSMLRWKAPAGGAKLYALFSGRTFQKVKRAAPGGEGLVLNHLDSISVKKYLGKFDRAFDESLAPIPTSFFNDSYEVYGSDWADNLLEEFEKDHGYRLDMNLPVFLNQDDHSELRSRIVRDYRMTLARMLEENFARVWSAWVHSKGATVRNQSHGSPANILDIYAMVDIPECESFGKSDYNIPGLAVTGPTRHGDGDPAVLKFASSAAHITGKRHTSAEALTWLTEHFHTTLARCKPELDQMFCAGVNRIGFHGAAYSPENAPFPGRLFYASINMSPTNSLWPHADELFTYIGRVQSFLTAGEPDNDLLLYFPLEDLWHEQGGNHYLMFDIHKMDRTMPRFKQAVNSILAAGYDVDYVSDRMLRSLPDTPARPLIVPGAKFMSIATLSALDSLARTGRKVILAGGLPESLPGNVSDTCPPEFRQLVDALASHATVTSSLDEALAASGAIAEPLRRDYGVSMIRRTNEAGGHNYFISLLDDRTIDGYIPLAVKAGSVMIFDPVTGESGVADYREGKVRLNLTPGRSLLLKTFPGQVDAPAWRYLEPKGKPSAINKGWKLTFAESEPAIDGTFDIGTIRPWTDLPLPEAKINSGTAIYSTTFNVGNPDKADEWMLDLGDVREVAAVKVNGRYAGTAWCVPYRLNIGKWLHKGKNTIEIEVTSLDANRIADYERRGVKWRVFKDANINSVTGAREFSFGDWDLVPCGLNSSVTLTPMKITK
ncbi:MAG: DUF4450 domain-containing protein [Muribaculaceae bacterium]|nr:DUF4450 domain-containing protein [Muribaculaceae bacterium]